ILNRGGTLKETVERIEKQLVSQALIRNKWNQSKTAKELGLSRVGLANKVNRYSLDHTLLRAKTTGES
ncbi:MAG: helix-turn-helix domain-containing protein, partial [Acidobacteriota bacterium]